MEYKLLLYREIPWNIMFEVKYNVIQRTVPLSRTEAGTVEICNKVIVYMYPDLLYIIFKQPQNTNFIIPSTFHNTKKNGGDN